VLALLALILLPTLHANAQTLLQNSNGHVLATLPQGFTPTDIAINPNSGIAAVAGFTPGQVVLVQTLAFPKFYPLYQKRVRRSGPLNPNRKCRPKQPVGSLRRLT
jgi:hypothetical protein